MLDLYAGSGALAIEALSRGAASAVLVDSGLAAAAAIRANLETTGFGDAARVERIAVERFVTAPIRDAPFDLVFLDPPYDLSSAVVTEVLAALAAAEAITDGATVVVERPKSGRAGHAARRLGYREGAGLRRYAPGRRATPADPRRTVPQEQQEQPSGHRALSGFLRSRHQRTPRHHRAHGAPLRRRHRGGHPQPAEVGVALHARGASGDAGRGDRRTSTTCGSCSSRACWWSSPSSTGPSRS